MCWICCNCVNYCCCRWGLDYDRCGGEGYHYASRNQRNKPQQKSSRAPAGDLYDDDDNFTFFGDASEGDRRC